MQDQRRSVSECLRPFVQTCQQFTDIREAWLAFLDYLIARKGADIRGTRRSEELKIVFSYVESEAFELKPADDPATEWFQGFERREDVLSALQGFLRHRGLGV
jgi:hypothetical protein